MQKNLTGGAGVDLASKAVALGASTTHGSQALAWPASRLQARLESHMALLAQAGLSAQVAALLRVVRAPTTRG